MQRLGIDYVQGDAIGPPEPLEQLLDGLGEDESRRLGRLYLEM